MNGLGIVFATLTIGSFALAALRTLSRAGTRVRYQDGLYYVAVRNPGEWHEIREFITPYAPEVQALCSKIGPSVDDCLEWVCSQVDYRRDWGEFWQLPVETIATRQGDCEDSSILLTSLIRASGVPDCYVVLGNLGGYGHAWCEYNGQILETTFLSAQQVMNPEAYSPLVLFNEDIVLELELGALQTVFALDHNEERKLELLAQLCYNSSGG